MLRPLKTPYLGTAEKEVRVLSWECAEGERVPKGRVLCRIETLKASFDLEAEEEGVLCRILEDEGARVPVGAALAIWSSGLEAPPAAEVEALCAELRGRRAAREEDETGRSGSGKAAGPASGAPGPRSPALGAAASPAARRLAREHGVDLAVVPGGGPGGLVRVEDVRAWIAKGAPSSSPPEGEEGGRLDPLFVETLKNEAEAFGRLSSKLRIDLLRRLGAEIGTDCHLAPGAELLVSRLVLGDGVRIEEGVRIEAESFLAGAGTWIGRGCRFRCRRIELGENAFFAPEAEIGGGGAMDPEALCRIGSHGFVGERTHLNPCRPLLVGDEVVISREAVLMTHSFGQSALAGYPQRFAGLEIAARSQIGIGCVLFPGVKVGEGAVLLSNSSLVTDLPPGRLFGGVPAVDLKAAAHPPDRNGKIEILRAWIRAFGEGLRLRGFDCAEEETAGEFRLVVQQEGRIHLLRFRETAGFEETEPMPAEEVRVSLEAGEGKDPEDLPPEVCAILLEPPEIRGARGPLRDAFREFLRKRGVRLHPRTWSYRGGWL